MTTRRSHLAVNKEVGSHLDIHVRGGRGHGRGAEHRVAAGMNPYFAGNGTDIAMEIQVAAECQQ